MIGFLSGQAGRKSFTVQSSAQDRDSSQRTLDKLLTSACFPFKKIHWNHSLGFGVILMILLRESPPTWRIHACQLSRWTKISHHACSSITYMFGLVRQEKTNNSTHDDRLCFLLVSFWLSFGRIENTRDSQLFLDGRFDWPTDRWINDCLLDDEMHDGLVTPTPMVHTLGFWETSL